MHAENVHLLVMVTFFKLFAFRSATKTCIDLYWSSVPANTKCRES